MTTHSVTLEQYIAVPPAQVAAFISDFRNAQQWMVGVETIEDLGDDSFRLILESPVGRLEPSARVTDGGNGRISWVYTSTLDGGGAVEVHPSGSGSVVQYTGEFRLKSGLVDRLARAVGLERFAHRNGERSLQRLKYLLEAHRRDS